MNDNSKTTSDLELLIKLLKKAKKRLESEESEYLYLYICNLVENELWYECRDYSWWEDIYTFQQEKYVRLAELLADYMEAVDVVCPSRGVEEWLERVALVNPKEMTRENMNDYRARWCGHIIKEFSNGNAERIINEYRTNQSNN